jgi:hypothetical protein
MHLSTQNKLRFVAPFGSTREFFKPRTATLKEVISEMQQATAASGIPFFVSHRVDLNTRANIEATAVRLQKTRIAQRQCRQKSSIHKMTSPALPTIT